VDNSNQFSSHGVVQDGSSEGSSASTPNVISSDNGLSKIALGALIGATIGGIAAALTVRATTDRLNQVIRGVGRTARSTADSLSNSVQRVGDAVNSVAENVGDTTKDVNEAVSDVAAHVGSTVMSTVSTVKGTTAQVNEVVKTATNVVGMVKENIGIQEGVKQTAQTTTEAPNPEGNAETLYKLIPVGQSPSKS
jgi:gas vesicle protein